MHPHDLNRVLTAAKEDQDTVSELTQALVRIPSRAGVDPYDPIVDLLSGWMREHGLTTTTLRDGTGAVVGLTTEIRGSHPGPRWVLDACLDSAPFGDENAWTHPPTAGVIEDGWMWGRGSADSKVAVAIFCHLATRLAANTEQLHGSLVLLFDLDEHTGRFGGAKRYFEGPDAPGDVVGVMIGYPGMDKLPADSLLRTTLLRVAHSFGVDVEAKIAGPSNIGNYLAGLGIPATAGFGVDYTGLHATDERIRLDTIPTVQAVYHATLLSLLTT